MTLMSLAIGVLHSQAQNSPEDYLRVHNAARAQVGVGPMRWDKTVEANAKNYTHKRLGDCSDLTPQYLTIYGENLANGPGSFSGEDAVNKWVAQKPIYDYNTNNCSNGLNCRGYTQVVWRSSTKLGCARAKCKNVNWWFVTCNYYYPGNYPDQRPY
ncbi:pathogenesis-related leaf protein 6-like [Malania oleifera]|uniref:pathogenesis-related leaf protein 6-like n=1 Tax=Malania oleifera TaxID=397392 RepID=UPI0025AEC0AD|nr:pathogenesis-related leaf protein 6-like [Malania oleifera]